MHDSFSYLQQKIWIKMNQSNRTITKINILQATLRRRKVIQTVDKILRKMERVFWLHIRLRQSGKSLSIPFLFSFITGTVLQNMPAIWWRDTLGIWSCTFWRTPKQYLERHQNGNTHKNAVKQKQLFQRMHAKGSIYKQF